MDHIYPQTVFTRAKLEKFGFPADEIGPMITAAQEMPNLQLLTPAENTSKGDQLPGEWLVAAFPDDTHRAAVQAFHHFGPVGHGGSDGFNAFFEFRRETLAAIIRTQLGVPPPTG